MKPENILMISGYPPWHPEVGGGDIIAYRLSEALAKTGCNITYLAVANEEYRREIKWGNIHYVPEGADFSFSSYDLRKFDLVHIHNISGLNYRSYNELRNKNKSVIGLYTPLAHKIPRSTGEIFYRYLCMRSDLILSLSEFSRKNISSAYGINKDKIKVMYAGVDESFFNSRISGSDKGTYNLLFTGRLNGREQKGVDILLTAMPMILKEHSVKLNILGTGPRLEQYIKLSESLGVEDHVVFHGFIENNLMPEYYSAADIFVFPTRRESFGLVLAEAMASGTPLVSTTAGAVPEVVEDRKTGILVPPEDPGKLAFAVNSLLADPGKRELFGKAGRERVKRLFRWEKISRNVLKFYQEMK